MNEPVEPGARELGEPVPEDLPHSETRLPQKPFSYWLRQLFASNPFYILSALLLLYGLYRVSVDPHVLNRETAHLIFNFSAIQLYEILLAATAILLARRSIWYDSMLLVGLENMLVLVPFLLISQAALIDTRIVWTMCIAGALLAIVRFGSLKRFLSKLNFPRRLAIIGLLILAVNAALPIIYRILHQSKFGTKPDWGAAYYTNEYVWLLALPALCGLVNFVPFSRSASSLPPSRGWWPLAWFGTWLIGTGVHLYCLGYVYDFSLRPELLAPAIWMLSWAANRRMPALVPQLPVFWQRTVLTLPAVITLLCASHSGNKVFLALTVMNATIYDRLYARYGGPRLALHLFLLSLAAIVAGLPQEWCQSRVPGLGRAELIRISTAGYLLVCAALSRNPKLGILGAAVAFIVVWAGLGWDASAAHWAVQSSLAFLMVHSLGWLDAQHKAAKSVRNFLGLVWFTHALIWMHAGGNAWMACAIVTPVLSVYLVLRLLKGQWGPGVVPLTAVLVASSGPGDFGVSQIQAAPLGILAVMGSFLLFALGTLAAISKPLWNKEDQ